MHIYENENRSKQIAGISNPCGNYYEPKNEEAVRHPKPEPNYSAEIYKESLGLYNIKYFTPAGNFADAVSSNFFTAICTSL